MWYDENNDNPHHLKPTYVVSHLIEKAGYHDLADYWNHNQKKLLK